jgi:HEAT repeat protein
LKQLKTKDRFKAMDAVAFLKVAKPESKHFKEVNETVVPLLRDPRWGDSAAQLLTHWANPDLLPLLEPLLEKPNFFVTNRLMPILEKLATEEAAVPVLAKLLKERSLTSRTVNLLKKAGKKAEPHLLPLINTTDGGLKNEIEMALTAMGTEEKTLRAQSVKDLSSEDQFIRRNAAERLKKYKPDPTMEEEFRAAGTGLLKMSKEPLNGPLALDVMKTGWVSKDLLPELLERLEKGGFEATRIVEILAILKEPSSFEPIAVYLSKHPFAERQVREAFIAIGSPAEEAVMKLVGNTNVVVNRSALQILGEIGTTKSLNALTKASATLTRIDLGSRMVLNATITKIKERMKK